MATHDLVAELTGYNNELVTAEKAGDADRVKEIKATIERVTTQLRTHAEVLRANSVAGDPEVARVQAVLDDIDAKDAKDPEVDRSVDDAVAVDAENNAKTSDATLAPAAPATKATRSTSSTTGRKS